VPVEAIVTVRCFPTVKVALLLVIAGECSAAT
jgi:hypothetical protein